MGSRLGGFAGGVETKEDSGLAALTKKAQITHSEGTRVGQVVLAAINLETPNPEPIPRMPPITLKVTASVKN